MIDIEIARRAVGLIDDREALIGDVMAILESQYGQIIAFRVPSRPDRVFSVPIESVRKAIIEEAQLQLAAIDKQIVTLGFDEPGKPDFDISGD